jgi:hypothetical protein
MIQIAGIIQGSDQQLISISLGVGVEDQVVS